MLVLMELLLEELAAAAGADEVQGRAVAEVKTPLLASHCINAAYSLISR